MITSMFMVAGLLTLLALYGAKGIAFPPKNDYQTVIHLIWDWLVEYGKSFVGDYSPEVMPFLTIIFLFILTSNWLGALFGGILEQFGFITPTSNISVTVGLAITMLVWIHWWAIRHLGLKNYLKIYFHPVWWLFPLNLLEHITRVLSLSLRLYGNISGEHLVVAVLSILAPIFLPVPMIALSLFTGFIQAYIFFTLGLVYIQAMIEEGGAEA